MNNPKNPIQISLSKIKEINPNPNQNHPIRMALCHASFSIQFEILLARAMRGPTVAECLPVQSE
jgi:hypothetical protein